MPVTRYNPAARLLGSPLRKRLLYVRQHALILSLLLSFTCTQAVVPPGMMLGSSKDTGVFKLCHGDEQSMKLLHHQFEGAMPAENGNSKHRTKDCLNVLIQDSLMSKDWILDHYPPAQTVKTRYQAPAHVSQALALYSARAPPYRS